MCVFDLLAGEQQRRPGEDPRDGLSGGGHEEDGRLRGNHWSLPRPVVTLGGHRNNPGPRRHANHRAVQ